MGLVLAIALGVLTHHLRASYLRARFLAAGNEALEASAGELRRLNQALESRVRARTQELEAFTHSISHDLKSPLGAILNFAAILELDYRDEPLDQEGLELLGRIRTSASRGNELLEGLLRLTRAGRDDLQTTRIDMNALAREALAMARQSEPESKVVVKLDPLPEAIGDRALIREALVNLFDNALKYSRNQSARKIAVRAHTTESGCVYEVEDNGQGFDMRHAEKLFGLFERLPSAKGTEGTGVGLALVARIIRRHDGRIWAESEPGEGAHFFFTLPLKPEAT
jgi:signal transduction histidine kinase